jgi:hypothetical protein
MSADRASRLRRAALANRTCHMASVSPGMFGSSPKLVIEREAKSRSDYC